MKTGATGGKTTKQKTYREEERGGEREARAGKVVVDMELGQGNLGVPNFHPDRMEVRYLTT